MANAAGHLRTNETKCGQGNAQNQLFGLDGTTTGKHGTTPFGDLATVVCSYDHTAGYSSNSLSSYFHDIGWRDRINSVVLRDWLKVPSNQTLGGNYEKQLRLIWVSLPRRPKIAIRRLARWIKTLGQRNMIIPSVH
jgi:hypothetical protein